MNKSWHAGLIASLALACGGAAAVVTAQNTAPETKPANPKTGAGSSSLTATVLPQPYQTIKGWGCYPASYRPDWATPENYHIFERPNVQRLLFKDLGITFFRVNILPKSYDAARDDGSLNTKYLDETLVRHLELARRNGMTKYLLTVWSPPAVFKDPPVTEGKDKKTGKPSKLKEDREDDYCRYVVTVLDYMTKRKGLPRPFAYSIQNEPGYAASWDGTAYDGPQWRRVFKKMRGALDSGGYRDVALVGPECGSYSRTIEFVGGPGAPELKKDKAFAAAMAGFAYHGYSEWSSKEGIPQQLRECAQTAREMGKDIWLTEWSLIGRQRTPLEHTLEVLQRLGRETAYIPTNYWTWWMGWHHKYPHSETLVAGADDNNLHISKTYHVLAKFWNAAKPGSVVKRVQTDDPAIKGYDPYDVQTVAFDHPRAMTVLFVNPTDQSKSLTVKGLPGEKATHYRTDEKSDMAPGGTSAIARGTATLALPPKSVVLLITDRGTGK